jgi:hypothetical protein
MTTLDAARILIRYALEEEACWHRLHGIVEEERERAWPSKAEERRRLRAGVAMYSGPVADWVSRKAA